ncbi:hypothetical protein STANM309S_06242 [Streptomyces tanashiensis]
MPQPAGDLLGPALAGGAVHVVDPQQTAADQVHEKERHVPRAEPGAQITRHHIERMHRRGIPRGRQYRAQSRSVAHHSLLG